MKGGKREGAGRKKGRPTTTISVRVPTEYVQAVKAAALNKVAELNANEEVFMFAIKGDIRNFTRDEFFKLLAILGQCSIDNFDKLVELYEDRYGCKR